jgi:hypothetical protein
MTLNNLAILYSATGRKKEAEEACREAESLLEPMWSANPGVHGDQLARILWLRALVCKEPGEANGGLALARRAFAAACNLSLKQSIQKLIDQLCVDSQP